MNFLVFSYPLNWNLSVATVEVNPLTNLSSNRHLGSWLEVQGHIDLFRLGILGVGTETPGRHLDVT